VADRRFLFSLVPAAGHVNPVLPTLAELVARGEDVAVWVAEAFADSVRATGARVHPLTGPSFASTAGPPTPRLVRAIRRPPAGLVRAAAAAPPGSVVVHDVMSGDWTDRVALPTVGIATTAFLDGPVLTAQLARTIARGEPARAERLRERLDRTVLARLLDRLPTIARPRGRLTLVTAPRELQLRADAYGDDVVFVGPQLRERDDGAGDPVLAELDRRGGAGPVVLVALGTLVNHRPRFYRTVLRAVADAPWTTVMAVGPRTDVASLGPVPPGVVVAERVPQPAVLARARAFVSHGGMGSVLEALHHDVPLVLAPQQPEQRSNARRVVERGAGVLLPRRPGPGAVRAAVARVLDDPRYAAAAAAAGRRVRASGGGRQAADVLQRFAAHERP
jgi:MGT family glycosyltransferase